MFKNIFILVFCTLCIIVIEGASIRKKRGFDLEMPSLPEPVQNFIDTGISFIMDAIAEVAKFQENLQEMSGRK